MYGFWYFTIGLFITAIVLLGFIITRHIQSDKAENWDNPYYEWFDAHELRAGCLIGGFVIVIIAFVFCLGFSIFNPINAKQKYLEFNNMNEYIIEAEQNGTDLENATITDKIIDENKWLANAKADKDTWGWFSEYCYIDLSNVQPIIITK